jgi:hypothetical protein
MKKYSKSIYTLHTHAEYIYFNGEIIGYVNPMRREVTRTQYFASSLYVASNGELTIHNYCYRSTSKQNAINQILKFQYELSGLKTDLISCKNQIYQHRHKEQRDQHKEIDLDREKYLISRQIKRLEDGYFNAL